MMFLFLFHYISGGTDIAIARQQLMMDVILEQISEGNLALLEAPPENPKDTQRKDAVRDWISRFFMFQPLKKRDALAAGIKAFLSNQALARSELSKSKVLINMEIASDMNRMQRQPVFMSRYRRYIVIDVDQPDIPGPGPYDYTVSSQIFHYILSLLMQLAIVGMDIIVKV